MTKLNEPAEAVIENSKIEFLYLQLQFDINEVKSRCATTKIRRPSAEIAYHLYQFEKPICIDFYNEI